MPIKPNRPDQIRESNPRIIQVIITFVIHHLQVRKRIKTCWESLCDDICRESFNMHSLPVSFSAHHFNLLQYNNLFPPCVFNYQVQNLWPRIVRLSSPSMIHNIKPWILVKEHRAVSKYPIKITSWPQKLHLMTSGIKCLKLSQKGFRLDPKWVWLLWKFRGNNRQEPVSASYSFQQCWKYFTPKLHCININQRQK